MSISSESCEPILDIAQISLFTRVVVNNQNSVVTAHEHAPKYSKAEKIRELSGCYQYSTTIPASCRPEVHRQNPPDVDGH
jgi:hypothetical protein